MPVTIVLGAQWGDEGKGKITDHLAERAAMVVRYQGGTNAGHTIVSGETVLKLHQVPSGITRPNVAAVMAHGMVITPLLCLKNSPCCTTRESVPKTCTSVAMRTLSCRITWPLMR